MFFQAKGYFLGLGFPLGAVGALNMIFFGVYGNTMRFLQSIHKKPTDKISMTDVFIAGAFAGGIQGIPATPIELIKCKLQAQRQELLMARKQGLKGNVQIITLTYVRVDTYKAHSPYFNARMTPYRESYMVSIVQNG